MNDFPPHYRSGSRTILRFALAMVIFALLSGLFYQESGKKLGFDDVPVGAHFEAIVHLAMVHGHAFLIGVLIPIAMIGAMALALGACGGRELKQSTLRWLTRGYLPFACLSIALMVYKGYHILIVLRGDETDIAIAQASLFGGITGLRHALYGVAHTGMAVSLGVFCIALWRSLGTPPSQAGDH
jgi:hypothetical protein